MTQPSPPPPTQSKGKEKARVKKGAKKAASAAGTQVDDEEPKKFSTEEDLALISMFMAVSEDPIVGTNMKYTTMFTRAILDKWNEARADNMRNRRARTRSSLRGRWNRIKPCVNMWVSTYDEAYRQVGIQSGHNEDDLINYAHSIYIQVLTSERRGLRLDSLLGIHEGIPRVAKKNELRWS